MLTLGLLALSSIALLTLDLRGAPAIGSVRALSEDLTAPLRGAVDDAAGALRRALPGEGDLASVRAERDRLRDELRRIEGRATEQAVVEQQLMAVLAAQDLPWVGDLDRTVARVVRGPRSNASYEVEIDKGEADGLRAGMPVVAGAGLVGRLARVGRDASVVQLLTDPAIRVGVKLVPDGPFGTARGTGDGLRVTIDTALPVDAEVDGLQVLTSGGPGSPFPPAIPVGVARDADPAANALSLDVVAEAGADLWALDFVTVLRTPEGDA